MVIERLRTGNLTALVWLLFFSNTAAAPAPVIFSQPLSPRIANYKIDVQLDTASRSLQAHEVLTWHNCTGDTLAELQFHLYLNAFRNNRSTLFREGGDWREDEEEDEGWGYSEIRKINLPGGEDLTERIEFFQPDDTNDLDLTVFRLPFAEPLLPGDSVTLEIDFDAKLPTPPMRTGSKGEYFFVGQWFPKPGVYIKGAWNCHQFHAASEFVADFGVYDVRIRVPENHIVGATGMEVEVVPNGDGTSTHYYHAEDVHDFAWTSSPEFVEYRGDTQDVSIRLLMQPDRTGQAALYLDVAKKAVAYMQDWIGDYPYPNVTVVDPRRGAIGSAGMEYPTLFTTVGSYGFPAGVRLQETTTLHEFAHQYWQGMVASNEFEEAWLDEGLTTYSEARMATDLYGPRGDMVDVLGIRLNTWTYDRAPVIDAGGYDRIARSAWASYSDGIGGVNAYFKTALLLLTLENRLGEQTMQRMLRTYFERWRFKHPQARQFLDVANEVSGEDLTWFFDQALYDNAQLDYSVTKVSTKEVPEGMGFDYTQTFSGENIALEETVEEGADSGKVVIATSDSASDSAGEDDGEEDEKKKFYRSEVKVRRLGTFMFPVVVEVVFDDGEKIRESWDGRDGWIKFVYTRKAKLLSATVDPDRLIPLDINLTNNSLSVEQKGVGVAKARVRMLFWAQFLMEQPDFANLATLLDGIRPK